MALRVVRRAGLRRRSWHPVVQLGGCCPGGDRARPTLRAESGVGVARLSVGSSIPVAEVGSAEDRGAPALGGHGGVPRGVRVWPPTCCSASRTRPTSCSKLSPAPPSSPLLIGGRCHAPCWLRHVTRNVTRHVTRDTSWDGVLSHTCNGATGDRSTGNGASRAATCSRLTPGLASARPVVGRRHIVSD